jgi:hypothetical protein
MNKPATIVALVLMPFDASFDDRYKLGIKAAGKEAGINITRIDEQVFHKEGILARIYGQIELSNLIIADMSGKNPNVFYEVGYAHARGKTCILITENAADIPFDLKHHRHIIYGNSIDTLKTKLLADLLSIKPELSIKPNPLNVSLSGVEADIERSADDFEKISRYPQMSVTLSFDLTNETSEKPQDIEAVYFYTGRGWTFIQDGQECPATVSDLSGYTSRHLLRTQVTRMSRGTWARIKISGKKYAHQIKPETFKFPYNLKGSTLLRVITSEGAFDYPIAISYEIELIPF